MAIIEFNFENLEVWKKGIGFASERKHFKIIEQLEAAAVSVPSNIAEGAGRFSKKNL